MHSRDSWADCLQILTTCLLFERSVCFVCFVGRKKPLACCKGVFQMQQRTELLQKAAKKTKDCTWVQA